MPVYRVTGWDQINGSRARSRRPHAAVAARKGTGLRAEYFANGTLAGDAAGTGG